MAAEILTAMVTPMLNAVTTKLLGIREIGLPQRIDRIDRFATFLNPPVHVQWATHGNSTRSDLNYRKAWRSVMQRGLTTNVTPVGSDH